ncbi:MAG: 50S ribosomal protein L22 [Phototrophicales bacterium]|jgi:large subunit ribosomal protein L22|nr:50S ribosomal protein L22 [Phototrophicales bacterium]
MEVYAKYKYVSISPQKLRLVCDQVRGMNAEQARVALRFMPQKGANIVKKTLESAMANAENNFDLDPTEMYVAQIFADEGPRARRVKAGARGRYKPRVKRSSHLTVILAQREAK